MVKIYTIKRQECEQLLGQFLDESHYDTVIDEDCDIYRVPDITEPQENGEHNIIAKFRKNYFTHEEQLGAYEGLRDAAQPTQNRGLAAGPKLQKLGSRDWATVEQLGIINYLRKVEGKPNKAEIETVRARAGSKTDTRGQVWLASEKKKHNFDFEKWLKNIIKEEPEKIRNDADWVLNTFISDTTYANEVDSGIAGWFDRYPRIPYGRPTAYTFYNLEKFKKAYPFLKSLSKAFSELLPTRYITQKSYVDKLDPSFYVPESVFTTITVNKNFRTAGHRDAGDLHTGFSNLTVIAKDIDYAGGYLVCPEYRAAINIRPGDLLLINNHEAIHGNTPIVRKDGATDMERISVVCYFRESMSELGCRAYEDLRFDFVELRRKNKEHKLWRHGWNGISSGMWESAEWYDYIKSRGRDDLLLKYHPDAVNTGSTLEDFLVA